MKEKGRRKKKKKNGGKMTAGWSWMNFGEREKDEDEKMKIVGGGEGWRGEFLFIFSFLKNESICLKRRPRIDMVIRKTALGDDINGKIFKG